ncbi:nuclear transport factor 2 family protein [Psychroserpens sp.]|uniref:nuclear transport factor 2 family protein n=1 Tax=Psychroserpens sp. TaxID=2020870 RepID=UPI00385F088B
MEHVIEKFYNAFKNLDAESMVSFYHEDIVFKDPAFGVLKGNRAKNMWRMLCESQKNKDFQVTFSNINVSEYESSASWEAFYTFSKTGRKVHNIIEARFEFKDGKIIKHTDSFNLYRWSKQALGLKGFVMGNTKYFRNKLKAQTNRLLDKYEKKQS